MSTSSHIPLPQDRASQIRLELKEWERNFAATHDGHKPSRDEVKANKAISAKYKEYAKLRAHIPASSTHTTKVDKTADVIKTPTKISRPVSAHTFGTPSKCITSPSAVTPSRKTKDLPWDANNTIYDSPGRRKLFGHPSTRFRDGVGPTPQKNGRVLGLFESFASEDIEEPQLPPYTPQKSNKDVPLSALASPSRIAQRVSASPYADPVTPKKRKAAEIFETPTFLRSRLPMVAPGAEVASPPVPRPLAPPKRGLSTMVKELREMEEHALDDEEEAMREAEISSSKDALRPTESSTKPKGAGLFGNETEYTQALPPGAFVEEHGMDEEEINAEIPLWKKKGLKRQTKRVVMRPVHTRKTTQVENKSKPNYTSSTSFKDFEDEDKNSDFSVSENNMSKSDVGSPEPTPKRVKRAASAPDKRKENKSLTEKGKDIVKRAARKINANVQSHMNFRKLNIKNRNSKGKGGGRRFGRK